MIRNLDQAREGAFPCLSLIDLASWLKICLTVRVLIVIGIMAEPCKTGEERLLMTQAISESHPLHRLFRGITEQTFLSELGIGDPRLVGYVANLLACFVPSEGVWKLRDGQGKRLRQVAAMVAEAESAPDAGRRRECFRHVGDFTLFWTGVYPEALPKLQGTDSPDCLIDYQQQGKRSYYLASTLDCGAEAPVLRRLSHEFELCAFGLSRVRREWERHEAEGARGPTTPRFDR
jgi:hypothetical protein